MLRSMSELNDHITNKSKQELFIKQFFLLFIFVEQNQWWFSSELKIDK